MTTDDSHPLNIFGLKFRFNEIYVHSRRVIEQHTFGLLAGNEGAVEESPGDGEQRPVLFRL